MAPVVLSCNVDAVDGYYVVTAALEGNLREERFGTRHEASVFVAKIWLWAHPDLPALRLDYLIADETGKPFRVDLRAAVQDLWQRISVAWTPNGYTALQLLVLKDSVWRIQEAARRAEVTIRFLQSLRDNQALHAATTTPAAAAPQQQQQQQQQQEEQQQLHQRRHEVLQYALRRAVEDTPRARRSKKSAAQDSGISRLKTVVSGSVLALLPMPSPSTPLLPKRGAPDGAPDAVKRSRLDEADSANAAGSQVFNKAKWDAMSAVFSKALEASPSRMQQAAQTSELACTNEGFIQASTPVACKILGLIFLEQQHVTAAARVIGFMKQQTLEPPSLHRFLTCGPSRPGGRDCQLQQIVNYERTALPKHKEMFKFIGGGSCFRRDIGPAGGAAALAGALEERIQGLLAMYTLDDIDRMAAQRARIAAAMSLIDEVDQRKAHDGGEAVTKHFLQGKAAELAACLQRTITATERLDIWTQCLT